MIEDEEDKIKIAENPMEAMVETTIKNTEARIMQERLGLELDEVLLTYLKNKQKK